MDLTDLPLLLEILGTSSIGAVSLVYIFHKLVIKKDLDRLDNDIDRNREELFELKGKMQDTKIALAEIKENSRFMYEILKEIKKDFKDNTNTLYSKIDNVLKGKQ